MAAVVRIISAITFTFTIYFHSLSIAAFVYFSIFSSSTFIVFLSPQNIISINRCVPFALARIMISVSSLRMVMSVVTG